MTFICVQLCCPLTKAALPQIGIFLSTVKEMRNISAQVMSLPLVFLKSGFLSNCFIFMLGKEQGFFYVLENRVLGIYAVIKIQAVGCSLGGEAHW